MTIANEYEQSGYPNQQLLVDAQWVKDNSSNRDIVVLDTRTQGYESGHIPGAISLPVKVVKDAERSAFAAPEIIQRELQKRGVSGDTTIIVYDDGAGVFATRIFYVLEYFGLKDRVKLLHGGYTAWLAAGNAVSTQAAEVTEGRINLAAQDQLVVTKESIQKGVDNAILLDARSALEYTGADQRTNRKGGHLKGAVHKEWKDALGPADGNGIVHFKDYTTLKQEFETLGVRPGHTIIPYCQSNQRGAHTYFILRLMGYPDIRPYEGSWDEWGNDEHTECVR
ncbi:sulfurtransferase [Paenibacillus alba]|uniref:sulfurtransferase n=1 Tax=Paenibacillus alba TaxID=1197127 RepID=UPI00156487E6|nr:rhodanese-like domain-containing protein [Paenibacillus alba]NQX70892.1 sulfurtransferase [Paenibacillus alba]